ncbi:N-acetyl-gamma-glutamyl-phosphate reductase [Phaeocystidibacter marisrubri]|uniref:N-acetyl-gamma-glutamyl-phosphate reductase n=1 Tax=Phaeocystidibacter marisrubri TaxID=1577780 RepID=A0A6L3ZKC3_9FLAO|nr:N-acetyl-gamma-glutamyl-phosphate reductase [Phaeocystidibacter marisrubri]KAB2818099.1 N-acetyl-gamma-glutamyl-phosphate reductase [Phaeocystidibacter marisrubri]GGH71956.1 N-acetyl-gamma-glutamyl-phosphate reductase [Phaeocystidibacter marisrubri]
MISVGIVGATGYVAGELIRIALHHPEMKIDFLYSHSQPGKSVGEAHGDLFYSDLKFTSELNPNVDVLFLCLGHGKSKAFLEQYPISQSTVIIDLSNDFRLNADAQFQGRRFTYGLVDARADEIVSSKSIANPGCFATAIQLALLPIAAAGLLMDDVHVHALTGSTGAGAGLSSTSHFSNRANNVSLYKSFQHQHLGEIGETLKSYQTDWNHRVNFLPMRGNFTRGIFASAYMNTEEDAATWLERYTEFYSHSPFTKVTTEPVHLKKVVNSNYALLQVEVVDGKLLITSVIDNLLKGAAGQAVENMNLIFGLDQSAGLTYKTNVF